MARSLLVTLASAVALGGTTFLAAKGIPGTVPPLGPILDPVQGAVAAVRHARLPASARDQVPGLDAAVTVRYDTRGVPHIFANSTTDAYRALGYAAARDRLFQMELTYRAAAGRLTELAGPRALPLDREARRLGLAWAADRKWESTPDSSPGKRAAWAFADGVNAYLRTLTPETYPVEYKLLGARPLATWEAKYSAYLIMRMALTLAYNPDDLRRTRVAALVGRAAADALFPVNSPLQEPIQPVPGRTAPREAWAPLPPPGAPDTTMLVPAAASALVEHTALAMPRAPQTGDALGSNNWAIAPGRTAAKAALLAGDPHLDLSLPSIWYEAHLVVPDSLDVYGVTFPGAPTIIIGFNRDVAWTYTNTGGDVADYFLETVDNPKAPTRYRLDGAWQPLTPRVEQFRGPGGVLLATDTVFYTHRGPVQVEQGRYLSFRWTAHDASNEVDGFVAATRARTVAEWQQAMLPYNSPTQNMLVADRAGTIALRAHGSYPVRPNGEAGAYVRNGSTRANDWTGMLPITAYPQVTNPAQGYIVSANQQPFDPAVVPTYIGADWPDPWRAIRLNELLRGDTAWTPDKVRTIQTDPLNVRARTFAPYILRAAERSGNAALAPAIELLRTWDHRYTLDAVTPVLFEATMRKLVPRVWDELRATPTSDPVDEPSGTVLAELLRDSSSAWWDDRRTAGTVESRDALLVEALRAGWDSLTSTLGPVSPRWAWRNAGGINVRHLLRLAGFSRLKLPVTSGYGTVAPASGAGGSHGASWRMVVELAPTGRRAWAIYPGGQSGNPASPWYDDRLETWRTGQLDSLLVPDTPQALPANRVAATLTLTPGGGF